MKTTGRDFLVYTAGPITGSFYEEVANWRDYFAKMVPQEIRCMSPLRGQAQRLRRAGRLIETSYEDDPLTSQKGLTSRDRNDCKRADAAVFNFLGTTKVSIGTCMELGWCDAFRIPMILIMEESGNIHDHAMVRDVAGFRVPSLEAAADVLEAILLPEGFGTPRSEV